MGRDVWCLCGCVLGPGFPPAGCVDHASTLSFLRWAPTGPQVVSSSLSPLWSLCDLHAW